MSVYDEKGPLDAKRVESAKPKDADYKMRDRDNMYLSVTKKGKKYWRMDYRFDGKRKTLKIGTYPEVTLKQARIFCSDAKKLLNEGTDPSCAKNKSPNDLVRTFKQVGEDWYDNKISGMSDGHTVRVKRMLNKELYPYIGNRPVDEITTPELLEVLRKIEGRGVIDTAHRAKQTASQVFDYAIQCGDCLNNPAKQVTGALKPKRSNHFPSITDPIGVGRLINHIDCYHGSTVVRTALKLSALLFLRPIELRSLEWCEIDFDQDLITIPARKMKLREIHIVPLARQAKRLLLQIQNLTGEGKYVFPSPRSKTRPISDNAVRTALRTMGYTNSMMVPHGFRAMARTLLDEELEFNVVWIEQQLAHAVKDANGRAYNRTKHLRQRREMMQKWADYLDDLKRMSSGNNVAYMPGVAAIN